MSPRFEIVEAKRHHCGVMTRLMRAEHQRIAELTGIHIHREMVACFDQSSHRKAWMVDGKLAALGGVIGSLASQTGFVWLVMSDVGAKYPIAFVKEARRQFREIMMSKREVVTTIMLDDAPARRMAVFLGFHVAHEGPGAPAYSNKARRELDRSLEVFEDRIITVGRARAILMGLHEIEEA